MESAAYAAVGTIAWNTGLVVIAGELTRRWMNRQEKDQEQNRIDTKDAAGRLADDLKTSVAEHRAEIKESNAALSAHLKEIYEQLRVANGRTAKIEGGLETVKAVCKVRHADGQRVHCEGDR